MLLNGLELSFLAKAARMADTIRPQMTHPMNWDRVMMTGMERASMS